MATDKFYVKSKTYTGNTSVISIRVSNELITKIEEVSKDTGRPRNEIISMALEYALNNIEVVK